MIIGGGISVGEQRLAYANICLSKRPPCSPVIVSEGVSITYSRDSHGGMRNCSNMLHPPSDACRLRVSSMSCVRTEVSEGSEMAGDALSVPGVAIGLQFSPGNDSELSFAMISSNSDVADDDETSDDEKGDPLGVGCEDDEAS